MIRLFISVLILGLVFGPGEVRASPLAQAPAVVVLLASNQPAYELGTSATFTIAVDNPHNAPVKLTFPSSQQYDIVVYAGETEVWRWSAGRAFAPVVTERSFPPGLTLLGRETWDWRDNAGALLSAGTYRALGVLTASPPDAGNFLEINLGAS